jgi:hypothetical protein
VAIDVTGHGPALEDGMALVTTAPKDELHGITDWKAGLWAGLIGAVVYEILQIGAALVQGDSPWGVARMNAAMVLGEEVAPQPATFDFAVVAIGMLIDLAVSLVCGLLVAWLVHRFDWTIGLAVGALYGFAIYLIYYYLIAPAAFPWFVGMRGWSMATIHVLYGVAVGAAYLFLRRPRSRLR